MILYTVIDPAEMFYQEKKLKYCYKKVDNCILEGVEYKNQYISLSRIISTNPKDYLRPEWTPGTPMKREQWF